MIGRVLKKSLYGNCCHDQESSGNFCTCDTIQNSVKPQCMAEGENYSISESVKLLQNHFRSSHQRCSVKKVFLEISKNLQENTTARFSFLIKFQALTSGRLLLTLQWRSNQSRHDKLEF